MLVYSGLLILPLAWAWLPRISDRPDRYIAISTIVFLTIFIGLHYQVGCDWDSYLDLLRLARRESLGFALSRHDPAYWALSFLVAKGGGNIALVNLCCAAIFATGLVTFCSRQALPSLALLIATPVAIATLSLGATRQSVAVGLVMGASAAFLGGRRKSAIIVLILAPFFHWTALTAWPSACLIGAGIRMRTAILYGLAAAALLIGAYVTMIELQMFVDHRGIGAGAPYRAILHLPALLATAWLSSAEKCPPRERALIKAYLPTAIVTLAILPFMPTAADRMGFYLVPLQMLALSRTIASLDETKPEIARIARLAIVGFYVGFFLVWLGFAQSRACMMPYRSYLQGRDLGFSALYEQYRISPAYAPGP